MPMQENILPGRRGLLALTSGMLAAPGILRAQGGYPMRSVRVINAYSPGGTADVVSRIVLMRLSERMGQQFVIENRPGAAGTVAASAVARATPCAPTARFTSGGRNHPESCR